MTTLERLGYANGQRLEADDLRLEQQYHVAVRRLLNRGLFTPGIVSGGEVHAVAGQPRQVRVEPCLALDPLGREVVLADPTLVDVPNQKAVENPLGYFLVIRYGEQHAPATDPWCGTPEGAPRAARIREEPELLWSPHVPTHDRCQSGAERIDCGVVLALVVLDSGCKLASIQSVVREYSHPTHASQVQAIAFEGEKDIDANNPKMLHFKVRGGAAQTAALYLWGGVFSSLYYTELGRHTHTFAQPTGDATTSLSAHTHSLSTHAHAAPTPLAHRHSIRVNRNDLSGYPPPVPPLTKGRVIACHSPLGQNDQYQDAEIGPGGSTLPSYLQDVTIQFAGPTGPPDNDVTGSASPTTGNGTETHHHAVPDTVFAGVDDVVARPGPTVALGYLDDLHVVFDAHDVTQLILDRYIPNSWGTLGNGQPLHELNTVGTGAIDLMELAAEVGIDMGTEDHALVFEVKQGGGKVLYNLYVS